MCDVADTVIYAIIYFFFVCVVFIIYMHGTNYNIRIYFCNLLHTIRSTVMASTPEWLKPSNVLPQSLENVQQLAHIPVYMYHILHSIVSSPP